MGTWDWDVKEDSLLWDEQMHALFGLAPGSFGGRSDDFLQLLIEEDRAKLKADISAALAAGSAYDGELRLYWPGDSRLRTLRTRAQVHCTEPGVASHMTGVAWDITERAETQLALEKEKHLFATLMENIPDAIYFKDRDSRFMSVNRALVERFGCQHASELIGSTDLELFSTEHAQIAYNDEQEIITTGVPIVNLEEKETWRDGHETWVSTTKMALRDPAQPGQIIGTFGISRDITERKQAQNKLAKFAEELRQRNAALEEELAMARELQTALLPQRFPHFPRHAPESTPSSVRFYHFFQPSAAVSGDFFDVFEVGENIAGLFMCDVMGHGVRAALVAAIVRTLVGGLRNSWDDPAKFLTELNQLLWAALPHSDTPLFASASYVVADVDRREVRSANAGHPKPVHIHRESLHEAPSPPEALDLRAGPALGLFESARYENSLTKLAAHDLVLLFTDGLFEVEGSDGELYDYSKLIRDVARRRDLPTAELCRSIVDEIQGFSADREFTDDVCLVAMEIEAP